MSATYLSGRSLAVHLITRKATLTAPRLIAMSLMDLFYQNAKKYVIHKIFRIKISRNLKGTYQRNDVAFWGCRYPHRIHTFTEVRRISVIRRSIDVPIAGVPFLFSKSEASLSNSRMLL